MPCQIKIEELSKLFLAQILIHFIINLMLMFESLQKITIIISYLLTTIVIINKLMIHA